MDPRTNIFKTLIRISGKILFVIGLLLNVCMLFFGFWPSLIYIFMMLLGAGVIVINKDTNSPKEPGHYRTVFEKMFSSAASLLKTNSRTIQFALLTVILITSTCILFFACLFILNQKNQMTQETIRECKEITNALNSYKTKRKLYPSDLTTLRGNNPGRAGWNKDNWGHSYNYQTNTSDTSYILVSPGEDGRFDNEDDLVFRN